MVLIYVWLGGEGSCFVDGFFLTFPQQEGCVERHMLCAVCTGQHGAVDVSGEMYDAGMGYTSHELLKRLKGFNRYFFGKMNKFYN